MKAAGVAAIGAPAFRYWLKNGSSTSRRHCAVVSLAQFSVPSERPSRFTCEWNHGPITRVFMLSGVPLAFSAR